METVYCGSSNAGRFVEGGDADQVKVAEKEGFLRVCFSNTNMPHGCWAQVLRCVLGLWSVKPEWMEYVCVCML